MPREAPSSASRRAVVISPNSRMADELGALLQAHLSSVPVSYLRSYPSPRDLAGARAGRVRGDFLLDVREALLVGNSL